MVPEKGIYGTSLLIHFQISRGFGLAFGEAEDRCCLRRLPVYCTLFGSRPVYRQLSLSAERGRGKCQVGISNMKLLVYKSSHFFTEHCCCCCLCAQIMEI